MLDVFIYLSNRGYRINPTFNLLVGLFRTIFFTNAAKQMTKEKLSIDD